MADGPVPDNTRWAQVEALFDAALEQPAEARRAWLRTAVPDLDLRRRVADMLAAHVHAEGEGFLGASALAVPTVPTGEPIGPYRVVDELGRGGMGVVYLAERADGAFEQHVALKIVKRGFDTDQVIQRFLQERQILARLQHPHIARLLDGGVTATGQPYFAMEHIDGVPLTRYCDDRQLDIEARLKLFEQVGGAVQYAHRNLIVHRDLKPSNILVTDDGTVKLLDFGIAKLLDAEADRALTQTGMRVLTPAYAAPEQVAGEPVTTAADIYSLGVVLYELLTGHNPHGETPPPTHGIKRPSAAVTAPLTITHPDGTSETLSPEAVSQARGMPPDRLRRRLSGDLDTICLKALRPEPEQRYDSAAAFVEDVKRHLAGLPVDARTVAPGYRLRKFVQRNRVLVGATAMVIFALMLGLAAALWQAQRAQAAAARAEAEAATAQQVKDYLVTVFGASNPWEQPGGADMTARELLARGVERVGALEEEPALQAELLDALGNVYATIGLYQESQSLLEQALTIRRALHGEEHETIARSMASLAGLHKDMGALQEAEALYRDVLAMRQRLLPADHIDLAAAMNDLAVVLVSRRAFDEAEPLLRASLAIQRAHHEEPALTIAVTIANLSRVLRSNGANEEAEALLREALAIQRRLLGEEHPNVAASLSALALVLRDQGNNEEAEALLREALAMRQRLFGAAHDLTAGTRYQLGQLLLTTSQAGKAEPLFRESIRISAAVNGPQHWKTALARVGLGMSLTALDRYEEAEAPLVEAHAYYQSAQAGGPPTGPPEALEALVALYDAWGLPEEARRYRLLLDAM